MHCVLLKKYLNQSFPHNSKTKKDIAKFSAVLKPMKSNDYVIQFWQKSEHFYFFGLERVLKESRGRRSKWSEKASNWNEGSVIWNEEVRKCN